MASVIVYKPTADEVHYVCLKVYTSSAHANSQIFTGLEKGKKKHEEKKIHMYANLLYTAQFTDWYLSLFYLKFVMFIWRTSSWNPSVHEKSQTIAISFHSTNFCSSQSWDCGFLLKSYFTRTHTYVYIYTPYLYTEQCVHFPIASSHNYPPLTAEYIPVYFILFLFIYLFILRFTDDLY
jgi:hypothetical protein